MVFYDNFAKPSPSRRSMNIESKLYYDKHSPTKESCLSHVKGAPTPRKAPKPPKRAMMRGTSQPSLSPSRANTKKISDLPFHNVLTNEMTPPHHHHSNTVDFSTLEGLSSPSFEPNNHGTSAPLNESMSSLHLLELDKPITDLADISNQEHMRDIRVTSWSNLDCCINLSDSEIDPPTESMTGAFTKQMIGPVPNQHGNSKKSLCENRQSRSHGSRPPVSPTRRSACKISQTHNPPSACASRTFGRRFSLGQTEHGAEERYTKSIFLPKGQLRKQISAFDLSISRNKKLFDVADICKYNFSQLSLNHFEQSSSECSETAFIASTKSPQKKQISANDLSTPESAKSYFPRRKAIQACDQILSPLPSKSMKTPNATRQKNRASPRHTSPSNKCIQSPCKQVSERILASPKWVTSNTEGAYKAKSIPKVSSVQNLLSEFDKIMELP